MRAVGWALLLAVALPAQTLAAEAPVSGKFWSRGDAELHGTFNGSMAVDSIHFEAADEGGPLAAAELRVRNARLVLLNNPVTHPDLGGLPPDACHPAKAADFSGDSLIVREWPPFSGTVSASARDDDAVLRILPLEAGKTMQIPLHVRGQLDVRADAHPDHSFMQQLEGTRLVGSESGATLRGGDLAGGPIRGDLRAVLYGLAVTLLHADGTLESVQTGQALNQACSTPGSLRDSYDRLSLAILARDAVAVLRVSEPAAWRYDAFGLEGWVDGDLAIQDVVAEARVDGEPMRDASGLVQFIVKGDAGARFSDLEAVWTLDGTASFVAVDAADVFGSRPAWGAAAAGGAVAVLFAALARSWPALLALANRRDPLANANRVRVLQAIGERPGSTPMDLCRTTSLRRSTVNFHLAVLRRACLVDVQRHGRFEHFMLNSQSYRFPVPRLDGGEGGPLPLPSLLAAVRHKGRSAIFHGLVESGRPLTYKEFLQEHGAGLPGGMKRTTFLHHAGVLHLQGILRRGRRGKEVTWSVNVDYASLLRKQARIYLSENERYAVLGAVAALGSGTREAIVQAAGRSGSVDRVDERLRELHGVGFLVRDEAGTYALNRRGVFRHMHGGAA